MNTSTNNTPNPDLDTKITSMLHKIDAATPPPPSLSSLAGSATTPDPQRSNWMMLAAAASIVAVGVGGLALIGARDESPAATQPSPPATSTDGSVADRLLYPTETATGEPPQLTVADSDAGAHAMLQAPDGTLYRVAVNEKGGYVPDPAADSRDVGNHRVVANSDGKSVGYSWSDSCFVTSVVSGDDGSTWAPERMELLESFTSTNGAVRVDLVEGWDVIDVGSDAPAAQLSYSVDLDGVVHDVVLGQSIGASIAANGSPDGPMEPVTLLDGTPAWFEPDSGPAPRLSFTRNGIATWLLGDGLTADELIAATALLAPAPDAWNLLLTVGVELAPVGTVPAKEVPELCGTPDLVVDAARDTPNTSAPPVAAPPSDASTIPVTNPPTATNEFRTETEDYLNDDSFVADAVGGTLSGASCDEPASTAQETTYRCVAEVEGLGEYEFDVRIIAPETFEVEDYRPI